jgi:hypothetical protein
VTKSPLPLAHAGETTRFRNPGGNALDWWRHLKDAHRGDPGSLARLRRARTPLEALSIPAAVTLARQLGARPNRVLGTRSTSHACWLT